jgi:hypothetical protein
LVSMDCAYFRSSDPPDDVLQLALAGLPPAIAANVLEWSSGQLAFLRRFVAIARLEESNNQKYAHSRAALSEMFFRVAGQLGPDIATWLEYWIFEYQASHVGRIDIPDDILEALLGAGLVAVDDRAGAVELLPGPWRDDAVAALRYYLDSVVEPPALWPELASTLFWLERAIRLAVLRAYSKRHDNEWRRHLPAGVAAKAVGRAQMEIPSYVDLEQTPNPLEWMTLTELREVVEEWCESDGSLAGVNERTWRLLFQEVEPIRNRLAHMRLMRLGDLELLRRWRRELRMRAPESFS